MNCIEAYFEMVMEIHESYDERNAFSQLDHIIQYSVGMENILDILQTDYCKLYDVPQKYKVYIAALTEYIFNKCKKEVPQWVYSNEYYLAEPDYSEGIKKLCRRSGTDTLMKSAIENAIPEFKKTQLYVNRCSVSGLRQYITPPRTKQRMRKCLFSEVSHLGKFKNTHYLTGKHHLHQSKNRCIS